MTFEILYEDEHIVAINKPTHILVHRTGISEDRVFVLQLLRDQLGQKLYPAHRLDRATSGVLLFGKSPEAARDLGLQIMDKSLEKKYLAITRGHAPEEALIDYPLDDPESGRGFMEAQTKFRRLGISTIEAAIGLRYPTARFSLLEVEPLTGRRQQIRRHLSHLRYPIIGDKRHGDVKQNAYFRDVYGIERMMLHALSLGFVHPVNGEVIKIEASLDAVFGRTLAITELNAMFQQNSV